MKKFKMLLVAIAAIAATALASSGSASATVFCKVEKDPCPTESMVTTGSAVKITLKTGTEDVIKTSSGIEIRCTSGEFEGELENTGASGEEVTTKMKSAKKGTCKSGSCEVEPTVTAEGLPGLWHWTKTKLFPFFHTKKTKPKWKASCRIFGATVTCVMSAEETLAPGTSGSPAILKDENAAYTITESPAACGSTATENAEWEITTPKPLYVAES
jgi:hypothetical protein